MKTERRVVGGILGGIWWGRHRAHGCGCWDVKFCCGFLLDHWSLVLLILSRQDWKCLLWVDWERVCAEL